MRFIRIHAGRREALVRHGNKAMVRWRIDKWSNLRSVIRPMICNVANQRYEKSQERKMGRRTALCFSLLRGQGG